MAKATGTMRREAYFTENWKTFPSIPRSSCELQALHHNGEVKERLAALKINPLDGAEFLCLSKDFSYLSDSEGSLSARATVEKAVVAFVVAGVCK